MNEKEQLINKIDVWFSKNSDIYFGFVNLVGSNKYTNIFRDLLSEAICVTYKNGDMKRLYSLDLEAIKDILKVINK